MDVEEEASLVTPIQRQVLQLVGGQQPIVDLLALFRRVLCRAVLSQAIYAHVPDLYGLLVHADVDCHIAGHEHFGGLPNKNLKNDRDSV